MVSKNLNGPSYAISAGTTSSSIPLLPQDANKSSIDVWNSGSVGIALASGRVTATAVYPVPGTPAASTVIAPGAIVTVSKNVGDDTIAGITLSGTGIAYLTVGVSDG